MLEYKTRQRGDVTILDLNGAITLGEALAPGLESGEKDGVAPEPVLLGEIIRRLLHQGHIKILLNLQGVSFIDSSGLGELVGAVTSVQRNGGQLKLLNPVPKVINVLRLTRLDHLFAVETDEDAAVQSFSLPN